MRKIVQLIVVVVAHILVNQIAEKIVYLNVQDFVQAVVHHLVGTIAQVDV